MSTIAYGLRAEYDGNVDIDGETRPVFLGGLIRAGARDLDVRAELDEGAGRIVVASDDYAAVNALDAYPALKRLPADDDEELTVSRWETSTVPELRRELRARDLPADGAKDDLVERLEDHDRALADGTTADAAFRADIAAPAPPPTDPDGVPMAPGAPDPSATRTGDPDPNPEA